MFLDLNEKNVALSESMVDEILWYMRLLNGPTHLHNCVFESMRIKAMIPHGYMSLLMHSIEKLTAS